MVRDGCLTGGTFDGFGFDGRFWYFLVNNTSGGEFAERNSDELARL